MESKTTVERRRDVWGSSYPEKADPNRPVCRDETAPRTRGDAGSYPEKCNPRSRRSPLTEDRRQLVSDYMPLASAMVRRLRPSRWERDELKSAAYVALVEAAQTFDPSQNVNFATFARHRIRGALIDYRRSWSGQSRSRTPVDAPKFRSLNRLEELHGGAIAAISTTPDGYDLEEIEEMEAYFRRLPKAQASACRLIYLDGKSQDETAALLGYSKAYLSRLHRDALESLGREYADGAGRPGKARGESRN